MTWLLLVAVPVLLVVPVEVWFTRRNRRLADAVDQPTWHDLTVELWPVWSTLAEPDPEGWSSHVGWSAWAAWLDARRDGVHWYWTERMLQGLDDAPIFAALAVGPRELTVGAS